MLIWPRTSGLPHDASKLIGLTVAATAVVFFGFGWQKLIGSFHQLSSALTDRRKAGALQVNRPAPKWLSTEQDRWCVFLFSKDKSLATSFETGCAELAIVGKCVESPVTEPSQILLVDPSGRIAGMGPTFDQVDIAFFLEETEKLMASGLSPVAT